MIASWRSAVSRRTPTSPWRCRSSTQTEVLLLVIIDEGGDSVVVTTGEHAGGGIFFLNYRERESALKTFPP